MITQADYDRISVLKAQFLADGMEPEDAEEEAADSLDYDYNDVLAFVNLVDQ